MVKKHYSDASVILQSQNSINESKCPLEHGERAKAHLHYAQKCI